MSSMRPFKRGDSLRALFAGRSDSTVARVLPHGALVVVNNATGNRHASSCAEWALNEAGVCFRADELDHTHRCRYCRVSFCTRDEVELVGALIPSVCDACAAVESERRAEVIHANMSPRERELTEQLWKITDPDWYANDTDTRVLDIALAVQRFCAST